MKILYKYLFWGFTALLLTAAATAHAQDTSPPILKTRSLFTIKSDFKQPSDVVASQDGAIYVLDGVNNRVKVFDSSGSPAFTFGKRGKTDGKFNFPMGIGIDDNNRIYIADSGNHRVQVFRNNGDFLMQFSTETHKGIKPSDPADITVNSSLKKCYVTDNDNHCVMVFQQDTGKLLKTVGVMGMEKKEFRFPFFIDADTKGNIYIVEVINTRVKVLDPDANYLYCIGGWGVEPSEFYRPKGVAVDPQNRIFVSDSYMGVIQVFDNNGSFLAVLGNEKGELLKFKTPTGIFIDKKMRLYVVEMLANQVQVLSLQE